MKTKKLREIDLAKLNAKLREWQERHDTPEKVAAAHRKILPERVVQSMAFENEPVSMARLKVLLGEEEGETRIDSTRLFDVP